MLGGRSQCRLEGSCFVVGGDAEGLFFLGGKTTHIFVPVMAYEGDLGQAVGCPGENVIYECSYSFILNYCFPPRSLHSTVS